MGSKLVTFEQRGDFKKLDRFLERALEVVNLGALDKYGRMGVDALEAATPKDTGLASSSWSYDIARSGNDVTISWYNDDIENGCNVAILLQYGHATKNGGYVQGIDYINPAMAPIFEEIAEYAWKDGIGRL